MTGFPTHPAALRALSDAAAGAGLWADAAHFAERVPAPDGPARLEFAWRFLRAGRPTDALRCLDPLPDDVHPLTTLLRRTAVAVRDGTSEALHDVLLTSGTEHPLGLRMVAMAAIACADDGTAERAATRFLALTDGRDPVMRELLAPAQMVAGEVRLAAESTELAVVGTAGDQEEPVRRILDELDRRGRGDLVVPLLSAVYLRTGRALYGRLLESAVPAEVRTLEGRAGYFGIAALPGAAGLLIIGQPIAMLVGVALAVVGIVAVLRLARAVDPAVARQAREPLRRYNEHLGRLPVTGRSMVGGTTVFMFACLLSRSGWAEPLSLSAVGVATACGAAGALVTAVVVLVASHTSRTDRRVLDARQIPDDRCRCWETGQLLGPDWNNYRTEHLRPVGYDELSGAYLRVCPVTQRRWLCLSERAVTLGVQFPEPEVSEPRTGTYL